MIFIKNCLIPLFKIVVLLAILTPVNIFAQQNTGIIKGKVSTSDDHAGEAVTIVITELKKSTTTDANGNFTFYKVPTGTYKLQINMMGQQPSAKGVTVTTNEVTT